MKKRTKILFLLPAVLIFIAAAVAVYVWHQPATLYAETPRTPTTHIQHTTPTDLPEGCFETLLLHVMPDDQNYMFSPFSLRMALAMTANGAENETQVEILTTLGIEDPAQLNKETAAFILAANDNQQIELNIANSIWFNHDFFGDDTVDFNETFRNTIQRYFHGAAQRITNRNGADTVNRWIADQTNDLITDIVTSEMVAESLALLVNAIYFKGDWQRPFTANATRPETFTDRNGVTSTLDFMHRSCNFAYYENENFQLLAKPYTDPDFRMYFVLPRTEERPLFSEIEAAIPHMETTFVHLRLPRFTTQTRHENIPLLLQAMGIRTAFCGITAEFGPMFTTLPTHWPVYITDIVQKTFITVDELGTEAAAATVVMPAPASAPAAMPIPFHCDRPFLYFIRNNQTGDILFMGEFAFAE